MTNATIKATKNNKWKIAFNIIGILGTTTVDTKNTTNTMANTTIRITKPTAKLSIVSKRLFKSN